MEGEEVIKKKFRFTNWWAPICPRPEEKAQKKPKRRKGPLEKEGSIRKTVCRGWDNLLIGKHHKCSAQERVS